MSNHIMLTLEAARVNCGFTLAQAAEKLGIHRDTLWKYEQDSTRVPRTFMLKASEVYGVPINNIFFGVKSDFFRTRNRKNSA
jgi:transcriptional regulator with XRE-family HTH domain